MSKQVNKYLTLTAVLAALVGSSSVTLADSTPTWQCQKNATLSWGASGPGVLVCAGGTLTFNNIPARLSNKNSYFRFGSAGTVNVGVNGYSEGVILNFNQGNNCTSALCRYSIVTPAGKQSSISLVNNSNQPVVMAPQGTYVYTVYPCTQQEGWAMHGDANYGTCNQYVCVDATTTAFATQYGVQIRNNQTNANFGGIFPLSSAPTVTSQNCAAAYTAAQ